MVSNKSVIYAFINGRKAQSNSMRSEGNVLYSYDTAIDKRMSNGEIIQCILKQLVRNIIY